MRGLLLSLQSSVTPPATSATCRSGPATSRDCPVDKLLPLREKQLFGEAALRREAALRMYYYFFFFGEAAPQRDAAALSKEAEVWFSSLEEPHLWAVMDT